MSKDKDTVEVTTLDMPLMPSVHKVAKKTGAEEQMEKMAQEQ